MEHKSKKLNVDLLKSYNPKRIIFDIDGTVLINRKISKNILDVFEYLNTKNIEYGFLSNDSSTLGKEKAFNLKNLGIQCANNRVTTSADLLKIKLKKIDAKNILYFGKPEASILSDKRISNYKIYWNTFDKYDAIILGEDSTIPLENYSKLMSYLIINSHIPFYIVNPDYLYSPQQNQYSLCAGSILQCFISSFKDLNKKLHYQLIGKPSLEGFCYAALKYFNTLDYNSILYIGDSLRCDIIPAETLGMQTLLVNTGLGKYI
ncbi:HAD hydrolase-like protein [bacterium]|nr:HAD hydrolase-like protein [bacterium]